MDPRVTAEWMRVRHERRERDLRGRAERLRALAPEAGRLLLQEFGARRAWLFGSLARGRLHEHSDVDLAVEGLHPGRHFEACARLHELFGGAVDLVPLETLDASFRERIEREGIPFHVSGRD